MGGTYTNLVDETLTHLAGTFFASDARTSIKFSTPATVAYTTFGRFITFRISSSSSVNSWSQNMIIWSNKAKELEVSKASAPVI